MYKRNKEGQFIKGSSHPAWNKGIPNLKMIGNTFAKGHTSWNKGIKIGIVPKSAFKKGHKMSEAIRKKIGEAMKEEKHPNWKGDDVGYMVLHEWVRKHLGKPTKCEHCGKDGLTSRQIHWANIGHTYKRNIKDWLRLCAKCHKAFDKEQNLR
jgi:hypothetical protein